jgi:hypothetical protein
MARAVVQATNPNLSVLGSGAKKKAKLDTVEEITDVTAFCVNKNNIIIGSGYRIDSRAMSNAGAGFKAGDYKIDIQTVTPQKKLSVTVGMAFMDPTTTNASLTDLKNALSDSIDNQSVERVS